jgi:Na+/H+ antiporter NhaD/arsenite permease-like protein
MNLVGLLITILIAVLVFWILSALTTTIVGVVGAILVLLAGVPSGGFGLGGRYGGRRVF